MKNKLALLIVGVFFVGVFIPSESEAQEGSTQSNQTPLNIQVVESPLRLTKVQAPTFGTYEIDFQNSQRKIQATGDLLIEVDDTRTTLLSSWGIQYEISMFEDNSNQKTFGNTTVLNIGKGELSINRSQLDPTIYQTNSQELIPNKPALLLQTKESQTTKFTYRVPKEAISMNLPNGLKSGDYTATQTITLVNLPVIDK